MYKYSDYIYNGLLLVNNIVRPHHKRLSQLMLYATTKCQSRCKHCSIWKKEETFLTLNDIKLIMSSKCITTATTIGLEGGEFLLHPESDAIMEWFSKNHPKYTLLTNGLLHQKVIDAVRNYHPSHLYISLDGDKETYKHMRGCDGYDKVIKVVETLKDEVPISLMFCLSPWNSFKDMEFVIDVAKHYSVDVRIGIYGTMDFFDTTADLLEIDVKNFNNSIPLNIHDTSENYDFVALYNEWRNGHLRLHCHSIFSELVIHSNGNVPLCQNLNVILGNIHRQSLDEIFNDWQTVQKQRQYSHQCNKCWINFHRKYDIILIRNLERLFPKRVIELFYGKYSFTEDRKVSYSKYIKNQKNTYGCVK